MEQRRALPWPLLPWTEAGIGVEVGEIGGVRGQWLVCIFFGMALAVGAWEDPVLASLVSRPGALDGTGAFGAGGIRSAGGFSESGAADPGMSGDGGASAAGSAAAGGASAGGASPSSDDNGEACRTSLGSTLRSGWAGDMVITTWHFNWP